MLPVEFAHNVGGAVNVATGAEMIGMLMLLETDPQEFVTVRSSTAGPVAPTSKLIVSVYGVVDVIVPFVIDQV